MWRTLPGAYQIVERTQGLLDGRQRVRLVLLIQIDPVGVQPPQACLDAGNDGAA